MLVELSLVHERQDKHKPKWCAIRESNPGLVLGKHQCYHYTNGAQLYYPVRDRQRITDIRTASVLSPTNPSHRINFSQHPTVLSSLDLFRVV